MKHLIRSGIFLATLALACSGRAQLTSRIGGSVHLDANNNGVLDAGDVPMMGVNMRFQPMNTVVATNYIGAFEIADAIAGPHVDDITVDNIYWPGAISLPSMHSIAVPALGTVDTSAAFLVQVPAPFNDAVGLITAGNAKQGVGCQVFLHAFNQGTAPADLTITLQADPITTWSGSNIPPTSQNGNTTTWILPNVQPGTWPNWLSAWVDVPWSAPIGSTLSFAVEVTTPGDVNTGNDVDAVLAPVLNAWDPNYKEVEPADLTPAQGLAGEEVRYTVHFQNTGNAPATNVVVEDLLPVELDDAIQLLGASHYCTWSVTDRLLRVEFPWIMLPDSGSDWIGSQGMFTFRTHTVPGQLPGTVVPNEASIYFDANPAVVTDPCLLSIMLEPDAIEEHGTSALTISPNPSRSGLVRLTVPTVWSNVQVRVFDASGRVVHGERLVSLSPQGAGLNLSALQPGGYAVQVTTAEHTSVQRLVIE